MAAVNPTTDDLERALETLKYGRPHLLLSTPPSTLFSTPTALLHVITCDPIPYPPPQTVPSSTTHTKHCLLPVHRVVSLPKFDKTVVWVTESDTYTDGPQLSEKGTEWARFRTVVRRTGRVGEVDGRRIAWAVVEACGSLHALGRVHGQVRTGMLFINRRGDVCLANGVGIRDGDHDVDGGMGFDMGVKRDSWGLGCILFFLWTGFRAFPAGVGVGEGTAVFPEWLCEEKRRVLARLLERDPNRRASVLEVRKDRFWDAFRDEGLFETMSAMGSGSGGSDGSERKDSAKGLLVTRTLTPKRRRSPIMGERREDSACTQGCHSVSQEDATSSTQSSTRITDYPNDPWGSKDLKEDGSPRSRRSIVSSGQPLGIRIRDPFQGLKVRDRRYNLKTYRKCFVGREAVTWLVEKGVAENREEAVCIGQKLLETGEFRHCVGEHGFEDEYLFYTFEKTKKTGDMTEFRKNIVLNGNIKWDSEGEVRNPVELSEVLLTQLVNLCVDYRFLSRLGSTTNSASEIPARKSSSWRLLLGADESEAFEEFPFEPSENIDYVTLRKSTAFDKFEKATAELREVDLSNVRSRQEKAAFAINMYNLLALHARILQGAPLTRSDRVRFCRKTSYRVGPVHLTLDDLLHGIIRGNKRSPHAKSKAKQFSCSSRSEAAVKRSLAIKPVMLESLFAINSTSPYDPPIRPVNEETVDDRVRETASWFIKRWAQIEKRTPLSDLRKRAGGVAGGGHRVTKLGFTAAINPLASVLTARLPQSFDIYRGDFENATQLIEWAARTGRVEELKDCKAIIYWGWDFGQCIGRGERTAPLCPMFWCDVTPEK